MAPHLLRIVPYIILLQSGSLFNLQNNACRNYRDYIFSFSSSNCYFNPSILSDTATLIKRNGYPVEGHTVATPDGYTLNIFRIPAKSAKKGPVLMMHGIMTSSAVWTQIGNRSLAFSLADAGYEVWLGTVRGSPDGRAHKNLQVEDPEFWNFNLDTLARYDIREQLKFVYKKAGKKVIYLGHSMGTTLGFMYAAANSEEAKTLLSGIIAMAPIVYLNDIKSIKLLLDIYSPLERELSRHNLDGAFYQTFTNEALVNFCRFSPHPCRKIMESMYGKLTEQTLPEELLLHYSYVPAGTSIQVLKHYEQLSSSGQIRYYNYGSLKNLELYSWVEPTKYDLSQIDLPVYLFYGTNDALITEKNLEVLVKDLAPSLKLLQRIPKDQKLEGFNHEDFIMARDIKTLLHNEILGAMEEIGGS